MRKEDLTKENFFELLGVDPSSRVADLFDGFYSAVLKGVSDEIDIKRIKDPADIEAWYQGYEKFSDYMIQKIVEAKETGGKVLVGSMSSEENNIESYFCMDSFEISNDKIYFNGLNCVW